MKKVPYTFKTVIFLLYKYYSDGPKASIAFFTTKAILAVILWAHIFLLENIFFYDFTHRVNKYFDNLGPFMDRIEAAFEIAIVYLLVNVLVGKEDTIKDFQPDTIILKKAKLGFTLYIIAFVILFFLSIYNSWQI